MAIIGLVASIANRVYFPHTYASIRRKLTRSQAAVLMYHRVCPRENSWSFPGVSPNDFEKHMEYFKNNFNILPLDTLAQYLKDGKSVPQKSISITFDDGYRDNLVYAYPILKKYSIPATVFLTTGFIGTDRLLWWDKIGYALVNTSKNEFKSDSLGHTKLSSMVDRAGAIIQITEKLKSMPDKIKHHTDDDGLAWLV